MSFPKGFIWGAAAAAYQIEGAAFEDGKGLSVWDMMCQKPQAVKEGNTGDVACDHYHRYVEDVALMKEIGLKAYRMSISWPRVMPDGFGRVNEKGLDFYDRLIDELLKNNITPYITLFHWDYPYELYKRGGWLHPDSPDWFAEYARTITGRLSDRVKHWMTLNEPQCFILLGHSIGIHAPGLKLDTPDILTAAHNVMLAHGKAVDTIRKYTKQPCQIGYAPVGSHFIPASNSEQDIEAARKASFHISKDSLWSGGLWMDPIYLGKYSDEALALFDRYKVAVRPEDMKTISQPVDFLGVNIYQAEMVRSTGNGQFEIVPYYGEGHPKTAFKWNVTPSCLYWGPKFLYERYKKTIIITENGLSNTDWVSLDGKVHDPQRIDFTTRYLKQLKKAIEEGVDIAAYFHWSIMDNFEWAEGYRERFGLIHVDFQTQKRTIKDSGYWYKTVIESNGDQI